MKRLAEVFANERGELEQQWGRGDNVTTEDLRLALRRTMFTPWCAASKLIQISGARLALSGLGGGLSHAIQISGG